ncbi:MAG UNVERIFIED_CONTAM: hypothetical protein LVT10_06995 [Anaerolineae bacterium]|jgi:hypothetical protein
MQRGHLQYLQFGTAAFFADGQWYTEASGSLVDKGSKTQSGSNALGS